MKVKLLPKANELSEFQKKEYAKFWFDMAKLSAASLVVKALEPGGPGFNSSVFFALVVGLTGFMACVRIGMSVSKGVKS